MREKELNKSMEFNFACYNYYTLYISYVYAKILKRSNIKCNLFLYEFDIRFDGINTSFWDNVVIVNQQSCSVPFRTRLISSLRKSNHKHTRRYYGIFGIQALKKTINNNESVLIVFKDNDAIFATLIEGFKIITKNKGKVVLIEEGLGLYTKNSQFNRIYLNRKMLKVVYKIIGMSFFGAGRLKQGYHPDVDILLAKEPENLDAIQKENHLVIEQSRRMFTASNIQTFTHNFRDDSLRELSNNFWDAQYFYIGQPLVIDGVCSISEETEFLSRVFSTIPNDKFIIIKPHPREESKKYEAISRSRDNILVLSGALKELPVEIIYGFVKSTPVILTPYSSAYKTIKEVNQSSEVYLLYKLLNKPKLNQKLSNIDKYKDAKVLNSFEEIIQFSEKESVSSKHNVCISSEIFPEVEKLLEVLL